MGSPPHASTHRATERSIHLCQVLCACTGPLVAHLSNRSRSRGGMADAYGSGPYGETRGGSTPLVSNFHHAVLSVRWTQPRRVKVVQADSAYPKSIRHATA